MKKLLTALLLLIGATGMAQVTPAEDTTATGTTKLATFGIYYKTSQYGRQYYMQNPALGKYDFLVNSKYLRGYYAKLNGGNSFTGTQSIFGAIVSNDGTLQSTRLGPLWSSPNGNSINLATGGSFTDLKFTNVGSVTTIGQYTYDHTITNPSGNAVIHLQPSSAYLQIYGNGEAQGFSLNGVGGAYFENGLSEGGLQYSADYRAGFTDFSLVDKGYVDAAITSGVAASNGLTKTGADIKLGGALSQTKTEITNSLFYQTFGYRFDDGLINNTQTWGNNFNNTRISSGGSTVTRHSVGNGFVLNTVANYNDTIETDAQFKNTIQLDDSVVGLYAFRKGEGSRGIELYTDGISAFDGITSKGITYSANYSANGMLDDRWIPDWGAVKGNTGPVKADSSSAIVTYFGDSNTQGVGITPAQKWTTVYSALAKVGENNQGIASTSLQATAVPAFATLAMTQRLNQIPYYNGQNSLLSFAYGTNELATDTSTFRMAYDTVLNHAKNIKGWPGDRIILLAPSLKQSTSGTVLTAFARKVRQVATAYGTNYYDLYHLMLNHGGFSNFQSDSVHYNAAGHQLIADTLNAYLNGLYPGRYGIVRQGNIRAGVGAGAAITTANNNILSGTNAGGKTTTGQFNVYNGANSGAAGLTNVYNTFNGAFSGQANTGSYNVFNGAYAGNSNTTGLANTFNGAYAGFSNTTASGNTITGSNAFYRSQTGSNNTINGYLAGNTSVNINDDVFNGYQSGQFSNSKLSVYIGSRSGQNTLLNSNVGIGHEALMNGSGTSLATALGTQSQRAVTTGVRNSSFGAQSFLTLQTGSNNTGGGYQSGYNNSFPAYNFSNSTFYGYQTFTLADNLTNVGAFGFGAQVSTSNTYKFGNGSVTSNIFSGNVESATYKLRATSSGTAGTDSILVKNATTNIVGKIAANYYATAATVSPAVIVSSAGTLTVAYGRDYVFTGTTSTYTLPAVSAGNATRSDIITIKNRGSGNITLNSNTGSTIYDGSAVSSITIAPGSAVTLVQDATYFNKE